MVRNYYVVQVWGSLYLLGRTVKDGIYKGSSKQVGKLWVPGSLSELLYALCIIVMLF